MKRILYIGLMLWVLFDYPVGEASAQQRFNDGDVNYTVERYIMANYPVGLAFAPDGRLFYTEKTTGNVRVISPQGQLQPEPVINLPTTSLAERGMLGITLDPDYDENGFIWLVHTAEATPRDFPALNVVRFYESGGAGTNPQVMYSIPLENNALIHLGGNLAFDDEGLLYLSVGDQEDPANSQDLTTPQGAIHRFMVTDEGLIPAPDNPFGPENSIYAYGMRNPFDFTIDPYSPTLRIFSTENGDQCDDKLNLILPGFNYGAGENYVCGRTAAGIDLSFYNPPLIAYTPTQAPTGIVIYDHEAVPAWQGELFFCTWNNGWLRRVTLNENRSQVEAVQVIELGEAQCRIGLVIGPEGGLYFSMVGAEGGAIYRLLPD